MCIVVALFKIIAAEYVFTNPSKQTCVAVNWQHSNVLTYPPVNDTLNRLSFSHTQTQNVSKMIFVLAESPLVHSASACAGVVTKQQKTVV